MIFYKRLELKLSKEQVLEKLAMQSRTSFPKGYVEEKAFYLYKTALHSGNRTRFKYVLKGTVEAGAESTVIKCTVRPTVSTGIQLCIFFYLFLDSVVRRINGANNEFFLLISTVACIIAVLAVIWQERQCYERFESCFETRGQRDGLREP